MCAIGSSADDALAESFDAAFERATPRDREHWSSEHDARLDMFHRAAGQGRIRATPAPRARPRPRTAGYGIVRAPPRAGHRSVCFAVVHRYSPTVRLLPAPCSRGRLSSLPPWRHVDAAELRESAWTGTKDVLGTPFRPPVRQASGRFRSDSMERSNTPDRRASCARHSVTVCSSVHREEHP